MESDTETSHIFTFYYGEEHLLVKVSDFLKDSLKENEKCFYCFKEEQAEKFMKSINQDNLETDFLFYLNIENIINLYFDKGKKALKKELTKMVKEAKQEGYKKIRILNSPLTVQQNLADEQLIAWEQGLDEVLMEVDDILVLCPYNVSSLINRNKNKSEQKLIKDALKAHPSLLSAKEIYEISDEFNMKI